MAETNTTRTQHQEEAQRVALRSKIGRLSKWLWTATPEQVTEYLDRHVGKLNAAELLSVGYARVAVEVSQGGADDDRCALFDRWHRISSDLLSKGQIQTERAVELLSMADAFVETCYTA
jgi:hypothetical protein